MIPSGKVPRSCPLPPIPPSGSWAVHSSGSQAEPRLALRPTHERDQLPYGAHGLQFQGRSCPIGQQMPATAGLMQALDLGHPVPGQSVAEAIQPEAQARFIILISGERNAAFGSFQLNRCCHPNLCSIRMQSKRDGSRPRLKTASPQPSQAGAVAAVVLAGPKQGSAREKTLANVGPPLAVRL